MVNIFIFSAHKYTKCFSFITFIYHKKSRNNDTLDTKKGHTFLYALYIMFKATIIPLQPVLSVLFLSPLCS